MSTHLVTVSVVSHRQNGLVNAFLGDLVNLAGKSISVVVTENARDSVPLATESIQGPLEIIVNERPQGFGANHNAAFQRCRTPFYCVANPDIRLRADPFPLLSEALQAQGAGVTGPLVRSPGGAIEDSARRSPTPWSLLRKLVGGSSGPEYPTEHGPQKVDWVAGMFMLFPAAAFRAIGGFDEAYFLYYEDVEICRRLRRSGRTVIYEPRAEVVHDAQRASRRNLALMRHHAIGIVRYLLG